MLIGRGGARSHAARGTTLAEGAFASVLVFVLIGAGGALLRSTSQMSRSGDLSWSIQEASLAMARVQDDLSRLVSGSVAASGAQTDSIDFVALVRGAGGTSREEPISYTSSSDRHGDRLLIRRCGRSRQRLPGVYTAVRFYRPDGERGAYLRVALHLSSGRTTAQRKGRECATALVSSVVLLARPAPPMPSRTVVRSTVSGGRGTEG
ncbi:MAG: hypothetical protein HY815_05245 [Candidatus Riflebacteria bacterium]|nr:hypothetical protein [Candidatus Riflebacteria bacterium]